MKNRLSALLGFVLVVTFSISTILMYRTEKDLYRIVMIVSVVIGAIIYILSPQIDFWWFNKNPPKIDPIFKSKWLVFDPYYLSLNAQEASEFEKKIELFIEAKEWIPMQFEMVADEIKYLIAYSALKVARHSDNFLYKPYDRIIVYARAFVSPNMPEHFHHCESYEEDGVIIFSADSIIPVLRREANYFDPMKYIFCKISGINPIEEMDINKFCKTNNISKEQIVRLVGTESDIDPHALAIYQSLT